MPSLLSTHSRPAGSANQRCPPIFYQNWTAAEHAATGSRSGSSGARTPAARLGWPFGAGLTVRLRHRLGMQSGFTFWLALVDADWAG
eukprot:5169121-Pyramimonas_sp.AAC.1